MKRKGQVSPLEECPGETAPALQHAPIMGQPGLPLASTPPPTQPCASLECKIFDLTNTHLAKKDMHFPTRRYGLLSQGNNTYRIIIIITILNGFAACQQCLQPSSPVLARNALLSVVKGLHQTFTPFFQPYLVLQGTYCVHYSLFYTNVQILYIICTLLKLTH